MEDYIQDFIRESEENVTELNNSLLELEDDPSDEAAMDSIFRTAHTLKGNFGAMGFQDASDLAHAIEDLLDEIRQGRMEVTPEVMDLVFAGVDEIDHALDQIEDEGESDIDPDDIIADIRSVIDGEDDAGGDESGETTEPEETSESETEDAGTGTSLADVPVEELDDPAALADADGETFHVDVDMGDPEMKGVDGMFALEGLSENLDLLGTVPNVDAINDGEYDDGFDAFVAADDRSEVESVVASTGKIAGGTVTALDVDEIDVANAGGSSDESDEGAGSPDESSASAEGETESASDGADADSVDETDDTEFTDADVVETTDSAAEERSADESDSSSDADSTAEEIEEIQSVRVDVDQLDDLHGQVEQLVTSRIKLRRSVEQAQLDSAEDHLDELDKITSSLQDTVMDMRLVPLKKVVNKFPRLVRDLAREQEKEVDFLMEGTDIELDRTILDEISDPLMHLLRNAVDHGIEPPEEREAAGKPREGTIRLRGFRERDRVTIEVEDDGGGIDADAIRNKAIEKGVMTREEAEELSEEEAQKLVFHAGFSTNDEVTDVSGRGVGMDVVQDTVSRLDGEIRVDSAPGEGTTFSLSLPVTVAIVKVLFVQSGDEEYGIPIKNVDEIRRMEEVQTVEGEEVVTHDDTVFPLVRLGDALDVPGETKNGDGMLVRVKESERQVAIHCDAVSRQEEVVVKPFEGILSGIPGLSGAAVLGEGDVVTILDVETL
ncbi:chemotaxis protein CheA [Halorussus gelatinilyticus]|uniref:Chemotaxis protein CheA n=1 Tax=Halorussus gelatinilyticus TaxID=2937524 RepID=A0A8U0IH86_9EURY|nr:chemotaxis protein CheA [Halorussus gelatinilyticus]UPW00437.1 chemotaxis protein CheA [Halorussus gelatinilyticus]